jgi:hypothetical protein
VKIAGLKARKLNSKGQTVLRDVNIEGAADLRDSRFLNLQMIRGSWPQEKEKVQLSGLSYDYICAADDPAKTDWEKVISWVNHSHFDRRNYVKLQTYFLQNNQEDLADKVFINMRRQEIWPKFWWQWLNPGFYLQLIFWDALAGYGREPFRIIWAALAMVLLGMRVNDPQFLKGVDWPKKNRLYDLLGRVLLSFEQFTPMVDLGLRKRWEPPESATSWHLLTFIYLQRLSGWILIPIFLTAIYTKFK